MQISFFETRFLDLSIRRSFSGVVCLSLLPSNDDAVGDGGDPEDGRGDGHDEDGEDHAGGETVVDGVADAKRERPGKNKLKKKY